MKKLLSMLLTIVLLCSAAALTAQAKSITQAPTLNLQAPSISEPDIVTQALSDYEKLQIVLIINTAMQDAQKSIPGWLEKSRACMRVYWLVDIPAAYLDGKTKAEYNAALAVAQAAAENSTAAQEYNRFINNLVVMEALYREGVIKFKAKVNELITAYLWEGTVGAIESLNLGQFFKAEAIAWADVMFDITTQIVVLRESGISYEKMNAALAKIEALQASGKYSALDTLAQEGKWGEAKALANEILVEVKQILKDAGINADTTKNNFKLWGKETKYPKTLFNWFLLIVCFGWIWMAF